MVMLNVVIAIMILILIMLVALVSLMMFFFYKEIKGYPISQRKIKSEEPKKVKTQEYNEEKITLAGVEYDAKDLPNIFDEWLNGEKKEGN